MKHHRTTYQIEPLLRRACTFTLIALFAFLTNAASAQDARVQIIHNAADPAAAVVDIYVNGALALDDFAFRAATPYLDLPADVNLSVAVAPGNSTGVSDALATFDLVLEDGETYVVVANGVLDPSAFAANPNGRSTGFNLWVRQGVRESIRNGGSLGFIVGHGVTDAPAVDIRVRELRGRAELASDVAYGDITDHRTIPTKAYTLDVAAAGTRTVVASYEVDFNGLGGNTAVVLASGFLTPSTNQNGPAFTLIAVLPDGTVVNLSPEGARDATARVQIIHNAADPNAGIVDVFINGARALNDFAFRTATPFIDLPAGVPLDIDVAPFTASDVSGSIATFTTTFEPGGTYVVIANGLIEPDQFAANPDGRSTAFTLFVKEDAREASTDPNLVEFFAGHAATDAPTVDVIARDVATLVDDAAYGDLTGYAGVPEGVFTLDVTPGGDNSTVVASFTADLTGLAGGAAVVLASGFLDPTTNQDGPAFGLIAVLPDGTVVEFDAISSAAPRLGQDDEIVMLGNYPNPFNPTTNIRFALPEAAEVSVDVFDLLGRNVLSVPAQQMAAGAAQSIQIDGSNLASGLYVYRIKVQMNSKLQVQTGRMTLLK